MKKIAFAFISGHSRYPYYGDLPFSDGITTTSGMGIDNILERYDYTGNKGNMIHGESLSRILRFNRDESCFIKLGQLQKYGWSPSKIADVMNSKFDLVIFPMANALRPGFDIGKLLPDILEKLEIDFFVFGLGMQEPMKNSLEELHPNLLKFVKLSNEKAKIFAVRGMASERWLKNMGFENVMALGCPSLFVYPQNIMKIRTPAPDKIQSIVTAGYISANIPRSKALISIFNGINVHYIMQQEMFFIKSFFKECEFLYNDATGEVDKELLDLVFERIHNRKMPFASYRWFQSPEAWRVFVSLADVYIGDRFHCGAASLQAGIPALILANDLRVRDMTDFFKIPSVSIEEAKKLNADKLIKRYLCDKKIDELKNVYRKRFFEFKRILNRQGIQLVSDLGVNRSDCMSSVMKKVEEIPKSDSLNRIIRKAKKLIR